MSLFNAATAKEVQSLFDKELDLNMVDARGNTPVHRAVIYKREDVLEKLLELGAEPNIKNYLGKTPMHLVNQDNLINILLKYGGNPYIPDNNKIFPFITNPKINEIVMTTKYKIHKKCYQIMCNRRLFNNL